MAPDLHQLQQHLNYRFSDPTLARLALTHSSASQHDNQRLEFLGDSLLGSIVAELVYQAFPRASEGELSRMRASLVNNRTLAAIAGELHLSEFLMLSKGEAKTGGRKRTSILAATVEALIAAVYLDGGWDACHGLVAAWMAPRLQSTRLGKAGKDPKTSLQELLQAQGLDLPEYRVADVQGQAHAQTFLVECRVGLLPQPEQGRGRSKREAEQAAARSILDRLGEGSA